MEWWINFKICYAPQKKVTYHYIQWWASYFLKLTSYKLQLLGKKVTKLQIWKSNYLQLQASVTFSD